MDKDTLTVSEVLKLAAVLKNASGLVHSMDEYAHLPPAAREFISNGLLSLASTVEQSPGIFLSKDALRMRHSVAFGEAADLFVENNPEAGRIMASLPTGENGDLKHGFLEFVDKVLEPHLYNIITAGTFDQLIQSRSPGQQR